MPQPRDRFLAFAFAAADLLVETGLDGVISFAHGAFAQRLGAEASTFLGRRISRLFIAADQASLAMAMASVTLKGRIVPLVLRLADGASTPVTIAALMMPGPPARLCFTIGPVPIAPDPAAGPQPAFDEPLLFVREAELALRAGGAGRMGLFEVRYWNDVQSRLAAEDIAMLRSGIAAVLAESGSGVLAGEIAAGRYGILGNDELDIGSLAERVRNVVSNGPAAGIASVEAASMALDPGSLTPTQAARTLRYAVSRFAAGGIAATQADGAQDGLAGIIAHSGQRARAMREAIAERRFRLQFQPIVGLHDHTIHHFKALLRPSRHEDYPSESTQDFVLFAEMVGLAEELDVAVLEEALDALRSSAAATVAVNVSGFTMQSQPFRKRVLELLAAHPDVVGPAHTPHRLLIELTETAEIDDMAAAADAIAQFRAHGVPVCLDDFGAGGAAFRYLRAFGVDYVKIDGLYVRAAARGARERGFVAAMVELAGQADAKVVAEMIETEDQAALMRELGVHYGQGWLFGRPGTLPGARR